MFKSFMQRCISMVSYVQSLFFIQKIRGKALKNFEWNQWSIERLIMDVADMGAPQLQGLRSSIRDQTRNSLFDGVEILMMNDN